MEDSAQKAKLMTKPCPKCGSDKMYGMCCGAMTEDCFCGSGKKAGECCMASPETHGMGDKMPE